MKLTAFSNFALRTLMYTALKNGEPASVQDIANAYGISREHLKKAVAELVKHGYLETVRGRYGGVVLAKTPKDIVLGDVVRITEGNLELAECFNADTNTCPLISVCKMSQLLKKALAAFLAVLDDATLADVISRPAELRAFLDLDS